MKNLADIRKSIAESADIKVPRGRVSIPRHQMPQIAFEDYPEYLELMRTRGVRVRQTSIPADELLAAQNEVNLHKVQKWMKSMPEGAAKKPLLVSADNYVLDGNHTWLAKLNTHPERLVTCIQIGLNIEDLLNTTKLFDKATNKTVNEAYMLFDMPESLVNKVQKILDEGKKDDKKADKKKDDITGDGKRKKKEKVIINPEIRPDQLTTPYKVKTTVK